jgi:hypothetical protein
MHDAILKQFAELFKGPLEPKAIAALRATTRLTDVDVSNAAAAIAMEEMEVEVEAAAT